MIERGKTVSIKIYAFNSWTPDDDYLSGNLYILTDVIKCEVVYPLNGVIRCDLEYPENGLNANRINMFCVLEFNVDNNSNHVAGYVQRFIIYQIEKSDGIIHATAYHISYALSWNAPEQYKAYSASTSPSTVLADFASWQDNVTGYTFDTSISNGVAFEINAIKPLFTIMMEYANAIGALWLFNNKRCTLTTPTVRNVFFRYDSIVSDIKSDYDGENAYFYVTGKYIYVNNGYQIRKVRQQVMTPHTGGNLPNHKVLELDLTDQFSSVPTTDTPIANMVNEYIDANQSEIANFKKMYDFEIIPDEIIHQAVFYLGDIVKIQIPSENNAIDVQIKEITFDVIRDRMTSVMVDKLTNDNDLLFNIESVSTKTIKEDETRYTIIKQYQYTYSNINANGSLNITGTNLEVQTPEGYVPVAMGRIATGDSNIAIRSYNYKATGSNAVLSLRNVSSSAVTNKTVTVEIMYFKKEHVTT